MVSVFNSVTHRHLHPKWHKVHAKDPKSKTVLNQDSVSVKSRLQVSSNLFVISYVPDPCANNNRKDWHDLHCVKYSEINSNIYKSEVQIDSLNRCFCSVGLGERLLPICMSVQRRAVDWTEFCRGQTQWTAHQFLWLSNFAHILNICFSMLGVRT